MSIYLQGRNLPAFQRLSKIAAGITMLVGSLVLLGWLLNITLLKTILPGIISIKANTALTFLSAGLALWLLQYKESDSRLKFLRLGCSIFVTLIGLLTLVEYMFGWNWGIDQLLFRDASNLGAVYPGRMSPITALNFLLLGSALLLDDIFHRDKTAQLPTLTASLFALFAVIGYLYGVESLYRFGSYISIALPTAITFLILSLGILFARPDQGWMIIVSSDNAAGIQARRLLPAAVVIPTLIGLLRLLGQNIGLYGTLFGGAIFSISSIFVFTLLIAWSTGSLYRIDLARQQAEKKIRLLNADLENRVLERTEQLTTVNQKLEGQIFEREQTEATLRQSEERFAKAFRTSPAALSITRMTNNSFIDVNESFLSLFGYTREEVIGRSLNELNIYTNTDEWDELTKQFREHGSVNNYEIVFRTKSGEFRNMLLSADILVLEGEAHALTTMLDITDRNHSEAELNQ